jgi:hypothetical protein
MDSNFKKTIERWWNYGRWELVGESRSLWRCLWWGGSPHLALVFFPIIASFASWIPGDETALKIFEQGSVYLFFSPNKDNKTYLK